MVSPLLTCRETDTPGWGYGSLNGKEGYFLVEDVVETYPSTTCVAIYSYDATTDNQLSFKEGDTIEVMGDPENGWSYGRYCTPDSRLGDKEGYFPATHVKASQEDSESSEEEQTPQDIKPVSGSGSRDALPPAAVPVTIVGSKPLEKKLVRNKSASDEPGPASKSMFLGAGDLKRRTSNEKRRGSRGETDKMLADKFRFDWD